jgi:RsiW-degrading membrane proteinase PrsW (M82 family)
MLVDIGILMLIQSLVFGIIVYFLDRYEKEPLHYLVIAFMAGMTVSALIPAIHSKVLPRELDRFPRSTPLLKAFLSAGFIEEFFKFLAFFSILKWGKSFNEPMDGIIYLAFVGAGFAYLENITYVYRFVSPEFGMAGEYTKSLLFISILRSIPGHILFAILPGFIVGKGLFWRRRRESHIFISFLIALLFHGFYDFFLFIKRMDLFWIFLIILILLSILSIYYAWRLSPFRLRLSPFWGKESFTEEIYLTEFEEIKVEEGNSLSVLLLFIPIVLAYGIFLFVFMTLIAL